MKKINVLRKLKYTLSRDSLDKIYNTFILPCLEYACELWDGCSLADQNKLEKIHNQAARIVTGLPLFASIDSLYTETGWVSLKERREKRKLCMFYKIHNNLAPNSISNLIPQQVRETTPYNLRQNDNYYIPTYRLQSTILSFIPSTLNLWNSLDLSLRNRPSLNQFKYHLKRTYHSYKVLC